MDRASDLLGPHGRALVPIENTDGPLSVRALISPVGVHRASARGASYMYVNGRYVNDMVLRRAVREALTAMSRTTRLVLRAQCIPIANLVTPQRPPSGRAAWQLVHIQASTRMIPYKANLCDGS